MPALKNPERILGLADCTLLKPTACEKDIERLVRDAAQFGAYAVCVQPVFVPSARKIIAAEGFNLVLSAVTDFPHGSGDSATRAMQVASFAGKVDEADIVIQMGQIKSGRLDLVAKDLGAVVEAAHANGLKIKVIVEAAYLTAAEKPAVFGLVFKSGADFIKTGTGFAVIDYAKSVGNNYIGADVADVALMRQVGRELGADNVGIKAAGMIRSAEKALALFEASGREANPMQYRWGCSSLEPVYRELQRS